ncbi:MAG: hypothetical protein H6707_14765 [Deltaproteobacteria bacterium]|nr:hypothetical protein [Deltaproteobacteria bacterium]
MNKRYAWVVVVVTLSLLTAQRAQAGGGLFVTGGIGYGGFGAFTCEGWSAVGCNDPSGLGINLGAGYGGRFAWLSYGLRADLLLFPMSTRFHPTSASDDSNAPGLLGWGSGYLGAKTRWLDATLGFGAGGAYHSAADRTYAVLVWDGFLGYPITESLSLGARGLFALGVSGRIIIGLYVGGGLSWRFGG